MSEPQGRNEAILRATIDGTEYTDESQSRIEDLLLELKEAIGQGGSSNSQALANLYALGCERKNMLRLTLDNLKSSNTQGTWEGNTYTMRGVDFIIWEADGLVTGIVVKGTPRNAALLQIPSTLPYPNTKYIINGGPDVGFDDGVYVQIGNEKIYDSKDHEIYFESQGVFYNIWVKGYNSICYLYPMIRMAGNSNFEPYMPSIDQRLKALEQGSSTSGSYVPIQASVSENIGGVVDA